MKGTKTIKWATVVLAVIVAAMWLMPNRIYYFALDSWGDRVAAWNGLNVELESGQYFLPRKNQSDLLIGSRSGNGGILQISPNGFPIEKRKVAISAECATVKCSELGARDYVVGGKKITLIEYSYDSPDPRDQMQSYTWVEGSPISIFYRGSKATYPHFSSITASIVTQIARSRE